MTLALLVLGVLAQPASAGSGKLMYRYINESGTLVLDDHVPPSAVARGYSVLGPDGRVIEEVPPQLDPEQAAARRAAEEEEKRLREWDESLLRRYSSVADIEAARERAINEIKVRINILRSNLLSTKSQIEREQARAADLERRGIAVPPELQKTITTLQREVDDSDEAIEQRNRDIKQTQGEYQRDIERFQVLLDRVGQRRRNGI